MKRKEIINQNLSIYKLMLLWLLFYGCSYKDNDCQDLSEVELLDVYEYTLGILERTQKDVIFNKYSNQLFSPMLENVCKECSDLGYEVDKSIIGKIYKDGYVNIPKCVIPEELATNIINDTNLVKKDLFIYSELFTLNDSIFLVAVCKKDIIEKTSHKAIFILGRIKKG